MLTDFSIDIFYFIALVFQDVIRWLAGGLLAMAIVYSLIVVTIYMIRAQ